VCSYNHAIFLNIYIKHYSNNTDSSPYVFNKILDSLLRLDFDRISCDKKVACIGICKYA